MGTSYADTIYLKNGRSIEGIIKSDDGKNVELEVGINSSLSLLKGEIQSIIKSPAEDLAGLRRQWLKHKAETEERIIKLQLEEEAKPRSVSFSPGLQGIAVDVLIDGKVKARMVLDTGASLVVITRDIADKLGINPGKSQPDMKMQVADGRQIDAKRIIFDRVETQGAEVRNVEGAVLLDEVIPGFGDGLLGMSFLKKFNFKIDQREKKLILEKLYGQEQR